MSEQELHLKKYVIKTYLDELLIKLQKQNGKIDQANEQELYFIMHEIEQEINNYLNETNHLKNKKAK